MLGSVLAAFSRNSSRFEFQSEGGITVNATASGLLRARGLAGSGRRIRHECTRIGKQTIRVHSWLQRFLQRGVALPAMEEPEEEGSADQKVAPKPRGLAGRGKGLATNAHAWTRIGKQKRYLCVFVFIRGSNGSYNAE